MRFLITGGCGFIGCNTADVVRSLGHEVTVLDNLARRGTEENLRWLRERGPIDFVHGDIRNSERLEKMLRDGNYGVLVHLAAQVAVTTSVVDPRSDFEINAEGTFNVLEAVRRYSPETIVLNASTNKVYGNLSDLSTRELETRYQIPELPYGVGETQNLDFHSPYGCSKGCADQYVSDYARIYNLRTVNFRQSCIYGPHQFGFEEQGWVAWFLIAHAVSRPVTVYGTGKQVRDLLHVDDLVRCYLCAIDRIDKAAGKTFNVGGGPGATLSLLELFALMKELTGREVSFKFSDWRPGDQPVYISDIRRVSEVLGWRPEMTVRDGVAGLNEWVTSDVGMFAEVTQG